VEPPGPPREADLVREDAAETTARPNGRNYWVAERRAQEFLRSWLSPEQRRQYDARRNFEVVGSDTGKRYRICKGSVFNIQELNAEGQQVRALCFTAEGVATGDVNLAQKIALETFESKVLEIANRSSGTTWHEIEPQIEQPVEEPRSLLQRISRAAAPAIAYCLIAAIVLVAIISGIRTLVPA
jgi:hypothetical protein